MNESQFVIDPCKKRKRTDAMVRAQVKYRLTHLDKIREIARRHSKKYSEDHREEILAHKRELYEWRSFINNTSLRKELKIFRAILLT